MWLNQKMAANFLGKSLSWIKQKQAAGIFVEGIHYFKRDGSIFYFPDKLDEWVLGLYESENHGEHLQRQRQTLSEYSDRWKED
ncbi:MAG: hypothetical protein QG567_722 [Campylobacterota bacterium]|nr:hypothetical protein [Campylobacterota bacterium]